MSITKQDVAHVAGLARLNLTDEEAELYTGQLQRILAHVEKLTEVDTKDVLPTICTVEVTGAMRPDVLTGSMPGEDALKNAPAAEKGCFRVPRIIE